MLKVYIFKMKTFIYKRMKKTGRCSMLFLALQLATDVHAGIAWSCNGRLAHSIFTVHLGDNLCGVKREYCWLNLYLK